MRLLKSLRTLQLIALFNLLNSFSTANCDRILAVFPTPGPSHFILVQPYLKALAAKGHQVTVVSEFPQKQPIENFHDVVLPKFVVYEKLLQTAHFKFTAWNMLNQMYVFVHAICERLLQNADFQALLQQDFDLIIIGALYQEALHALGAHFKAPIIAISTLGTTYSPDQAVGNISPLSYVPHILDGFSDRMSYFERLQSYYTNTVEWYLYHTVHMPMQNSLYGKYFPKLRQSLSEICRNVSLIMLNQHFSLSFARPYVPNMIEVGGFHIAAKTQPLPSDLQQFIDEADMGVIYFSMGSSFKGSSLLSAKLPIILKAFAALPQRVLWKFEDDQLPDKPNNVYICKWVPQLDVLAHTNVKLFITHGGLLSTIEAIHYAKPIVGVPVVFDQISNMKNAVTAGYALSVDFNTFEGFESAIREVLSNQSFAQNIAKISRRYHDRAMKPLDTALYWTEYVLRHKGAMHLRNAGVDMNSFQRNSWDVALVFYGVPLLLVTLAIVWFKKLICRFCVARQSVSTLRPKKIN